MNASELLETKFLATGNRVLDERRRRGRSADWLKTECTRRQEFVIGGFTDPQGARSGLGALRGATVVAPFSTRARPGAAISVPLHWDELERVSPDRPITIASVAARLAGRDPWKGYESSRRSLKDIPRATRAR